MDGREPRAAAARCTPDVFEEQSMPKLAVLFFACGLLLAGCAEVGGSPGAGRASPDPADQSPNH